MSDSSRGAGMIRIRFVKTAIFLQFNSSFSYVRRPPAADSVVKIRMIRFVDLPFIFMSPGGWRSDAGRQMPKPNENQRLKIENQNDKSKCKT
jgi:hypothetical protein